MNHILSYKFFLNENEKLIFGHKYDDLLTNISNKESGLGHDQIEDARESLDYKIEQLYEIQKESYIQLYRLIFSKKKEDIDLNNIGNHFVSDVSDFHEDMIDYLYYNAKNINNDIEEHDLWLIQIEANTKDVDYYETILTYSLHPNEDEITLKNTSNIKIINISKYFED